MPLIEYESLDFENAYIYRKCSFPLENQGLVLVRGLNVDDGGYLGAGKSSIFEVFASLQVGRGGKRERRQGNFRTNLVNSFVGEDMVASLKLRVDGHPYEIRQYQQHHRFHNKILVIDRVTGQDIRPRSSGHSPFKWVRDEFLRIDETTFFNLIYLVQELNNVMIHGKEYERRNRLTAMFDLDIYDELRALAKRALSMHTTSMSDFEEVRSELREVKQKIFALPDLVDLEAEFETAEALLNHMQEQHEEDTQEYTQVADLCSKLRQRSTGRRQIMSKFKGSSLTNTFDHPKDITIRNVKRWKSRYDNFSADYMAAQTDLEKLEKRDALRAQLLKLSDRDAEEIQDDLTDTKTKLTYMNQVELPQSEERQSLLIKLQRLTEPVTPLEELEDELEAEQKEETELKRDVKDLDAEVREAVCPHCKRPFDMTAEELAEKRGRLATARDRLQELTRTIHKLKKEIKASRDIKNIRGRLKAFETQRSPEEVTEDIRELSGKERRLASELETSRQRTRIEAELETMPTASKDELIEKCSKLRRSVERARERHEVGKFIVEKLEELKNLPKGSLDEAQGLLRELQGRMTRMSSKISQASADATHLKERVNELRQLLRRETTLKRTLEKQKAIVSEITCLEALNKAFGTNGMKQDRFATILSDAAERTVPAYSDILWPNRNVSLDLSGEDGSSLQFALGRQSGNVATRSSMLSGGERHKAGLAFLFGLRDLKELYTGSRSNVLIVDEPFGNLDPLGTEGLISIFALLKQKFGSVFVISHRPEVLSHPVWDQTWWAIRENNNATLYLEDPPARYHQIANNLVKQ